MAAAVLNACSELSTGWSLPKKTSTSTSTTGLPEMTPFSICSRTPFSTAGMYWLGIAPPLTASTKLKPLPRSTRPDPEVDLGELAAAAGLLLVPVVGLGVAGDRLQVGHVRDVRVHVELVAVLEPLLDHVEVQVAHPRDHQLVRLGVAADRERRVLVGDLGQPGRDLGLVLAGLGLDGAGDHRGRELDRHGP